MINFLSKVNGCPNFSSNYQVSEPKFKLNYAKDTLSFKGSIEREWADNISSETKREILNAVESDNLEGLKRLGTGADGTVYKLGAIAGYPRGIVVKISHSEDKNQDSGEMQRVGIDFAKEKEFLKKTGDINPESQQYIGSMKLRDGRNVLLSTLVQGRSPNPDSNPLNKENLRSILTALGNLDEKGILHRDLKKENIFVDADNKAGLLDYGEAINFSINDFDENVNNNHFASFEVPSNIKNFESTLLSSYMNELLKRDSEAAKELFREYLQLRAEIIHEPTANRLEDYLQENEQNLGEDEKTQLESMVQYQRLSAKVLANPTTNIVGTELLKSQIPYNSELAYKNEVLLLNPLANVTLKMNSLIAAKKLENATMQLLKRPNSVETKKYLEFQQEYAQYHLKKVSSWTDGLVGWLLGCLQTPIAEANEHQKPVIDQLLADDLNKFEIPDIIGAKNANKGTK